MEMPKEQVELKADRGEAVQLELVRDSMGRIIKEISTERWFGNAGSGYQLWHDLITITDIEYDVDGNVLSKHKKSPFYEEIFTAEYNAAGNILKSHLSSGSADAGNWGAGVVNPRIEDITYTYDTDGRLKSMNKDGNRDSSAETYEYDKDGKLSVEHWEGNGQQGDIIYDYNDAGEPMRRTIVSYDTDGKEETRIVQEYNRETSAYGS